MLDQVVEKTSKLRVQVHDWAAKPDWDFFVKYELKPQSFLDKILWCTISGPGRILRLLGLSRYFYIKQGWDARLKHAPRPDDARTLVFWNDIADKAEAHAACEKGRVLLQDKKDYVPVLVTEHADFAYYSRLGWLVEYLPRIAGKETSPEAYVETKKKYLAFRYREALHMPLSAVCLQKNDFWSLVNAEL